MAITTLAQLQAAMEAAQFIYFIKTSTNIPSAGQWYSQFNTSGSPPAGALPGTSTAAGVVPDDSTTGCPTINNFAAGKTGYLGNIRFSIGGAAVVGPVRLRLFDMLFKAGAYAFNANVTLAAQPSYSGRIPGADYKGTELWVENASALTGSLTVTVTYTNQDGTAGRSTSLIIPNGNVTSVNQIPLAAGDTGVQKVESVVGSVATAGTFNILVLRPLWMGLFNLGTDPITHGADLTDLPIIFDNSALFVIHRHINNGPANIDLALSVING